MNSKLRTGLMIGIPFGLFYVATNLLANLLAAPGAITGKVISGAVMQGIFSAIIAGVLFPFFFQRFVNSKMVANDTKIEMEPDEKVIHEGGANHWVGSEAVGGKLYLTNKRVIFTSHKINIQVHQMAIPLASVRELDRYKTAGVINNGLAITDDQQRVEKFVVNTPAKWLALISANQQILR